MNLGPGDTAQWQSACLARVGVQSLAPKKEGKGKNREEKGRGRKAWVEKGSGIWSPASGTIWGRLWNLWEVEPCWRKFESVSPHPPSSSFSLLRSYSWDVIAQFLLLSPFLPAAVLSYPSGTRSQIKLFLLQVALNIVFLYSYRTVTNAETDRGDRKVGVEMGGEGGEGKERRTWPSRGICNR